MQESKPASGVDFFQLKNQYPLRGELLPPSKKGDEGLSI